MIIDVIQNYIGESQKCRDKKKMIVAKHTTFDDQFC